MAIPGLQQHSCAFQPGSGEYLLTLPGHVQGLYEKRCTMKRRSKENPSRQSWIWSPAQGVEVQDKRKRWLDSDEGF